MRTAAAWTFSPTSAQARRGLLPGRSGRGCRCGMGDEVVFLGMGSLWKLRCLARACITLKSVVL